MEAINLGREELYNLVWAKPVSYIADGYAGNAGISANI